MIQKENFMPPVRKFQKQDIIDTAYEIVKNEGFERKYHVKKLNNYYQVQFWKFL